MHGEWSILKGSYEGKSLVVRLNNGVKRFVGDKRYTYKIGIAVPLKNPSETGLPSEEENIRFFEIEDRITRYFNENNCGHLCVVIATQGMKEFMSYATVDNIDDLIIMLTEDFSGYDFQHYVEKDTQWDGYRQFLG